MPTSPRRPAAERGRLRAVKPLPDSLPAAPLTYFLLRVLMISLPDKDLVTCRFHGADRTQGRSNFAFLKTVSSLRKDRQLCLPLGGAPGRQHCCPVARAPAGADGPRRSPGAPGAWAQGLAWAVQRPRCRAGQGSRSDQEGREATSRCDSCLFTNRTSCVPCLRACGVSCLWRF